MILVLAIAMPHDAPPTSASRLSSSLGRATSYRLTLIVVSALILLGVGCRMSYLSEPVFWVDEVATATRVSGYARGEIVAELADGDGRSPAALQRYQQLPSDRTWKDTLHALCQSPEHAPLYFLGAGLWMRLFGTSIVALRSFSVVLGLLLLPALYGFCRVLFPHPQVAAWTVAIAAVSPYLIAYSKEARPYSLWALVLVGGSTMLVLAWQRQTGRAWLGYATTVALMLYTSLLSAPVLVGHSLYAYFQNRGQGMSQMRYFWLALGLGILAFSPWIGVMVQNWNLLETNTAWSRSPLNPFIRLGIWLYSFAILILDVPIAPFPGLLAGVQGIVALFVLIMMGWAVWAMLGHTTRAQWSVLLALALPTPLVLILLDSLHGGQVSATSRYLFPPQIALIIVLGWFFAQRLTSHPRSTRWLLMTLLLVCLVSNRFGLGRSPNYQKDRNIHNPEVIQVLNTTPAPLLLVPASQVFDALSLSHSLDNTVTLRFLPDDQLPAKLPDRLDDASIFLLNPTEVERDRFTQTHPIHLKEAYEPKLLAEGDNYLSLWQVIYALPID
ncbi:MAG: glycosyltransferase family 39 protein [Cyanobacteria bacterium J06638_20]